MKSCFGYQWLMKWCKSSHALLLFLVRWKPRVAFSGKPEREPSLVKSSLPRSHGARKLLLQLDFLPLCVL